MFSREATFFLLSVSLITSARRGKMGADKGKKVASREKII
jgi:hypothetical protein